jgi:hypothetical protein
VDATAFRSSMKSPERLLAILYSCRGSIVKLGFTCRWHDLTRQQSGGDHGCMPRQPIHDEKQPTAARALAGIGIRELAAAADIAPRILYRFAGGVIPIFEKTAMAVCSAPCGYGSWPLLQQPRRTRGERGDRSAPWCAGRCRGGA